MVTIVRNSSNPFQCASGFLCPLLSIVLGYYRIPFIVDSTETRCGCRVCPLILKGVTCMSLNQTFCIRGTFSPASDHSCLCNIHVVGTKLMIVQHFDVLCIAIVSSLRCKMIPARTKTYSSWDPGHVRLSLTDNLGRVMTVYSAMIRSVTPFLIQSWSGLLIRAIFGSIG